MYDVEYKTYIKKLTQNGYKKVNIPELEEKIIEIYVNKNGNVKSLRLFENGYKRIVAPILNRLWTIAIPAALAGNPRNAKSINVLSR